MRVYLAAPYVARETIKGCADELTRAGFTPTSSWLDEKHEIKPSTAGAATGISDVEASGHAVKDFLDIKRSDLVVLFTADYLQTPVPFGNSGGRHVETGFALALNKPIIVVGEAENVFHRLAPKPGTHGWSVAVLPDWHETLIELVARREAEPVPVSECGCA